MVERGRPSYYNIGEEGPDGMVRRSRRQSQEPPSLQQARQATSCSWSVEVLPLVPCRTCRHREQLEQALCCHREALEVPRQESPHRCSPLTTPPGLGGQQPQLDTAAVQAALESHVLVQTVQQQQQHMQQQQQQISQMMSLVEAMLSNRGNGEGNSSRQERANVSISSLSSSADHAMEVDDGAHQESKGGELCTEASHAKWFTHVERQAFGNRSVG